MRNKLKILVVVLLTVITLSISACAPATGSPSPGSSFPNIGKLTDYRAENAQTLAKNAPAPNFQYQTADGRNIYLSDLKGKVVLLNFWATWCPYCVAEMPYLQKASDELSSNGLIILGIDDGEPEKDVQKFVSQKKIQFQIILDPDLYASLLYRANVFPTTYIIDKTGKINTARIGAYDNAEEIIAAVKAVLEQ